MTCGRKLGGGRRNPPQAFTEHGAIMAATILRSPLSAAVSVQVIDAFIRIRSVLPSYEGLHARITNLEKRSENQEQATYLIFEEIEKLKALEEGKQSDKGTIGFKTPTETK